MVLFLSCFFFLRIYIPYICFCFFFPFCFLVSYFKLFMLILSSCSLPATVFFVCFFFAHQLRCIHLCLAWLSSLVCRILASHVPSSSPWTLLLCSAPACFNPVFLHASFHKFHDTSDCLLFHSTKPTMTLHAKIPSKYIDAYDWWVTEFWKASEICTL